MIRWLEHLETGAAVVERTTDGLPVLVRHGRRLYLGGWPDAAAARRVLRALAAEVGLDPIDVPDGVRRRRTGAETFLFNYAAEPRAFEGHALPPAGVVRVAGP